MDAIIIVGVTTHLITAIAAFLAANYTYKYVKQSSHYLVVKEKLPYFSLGLSGFGLASLLDAVSLLAGLNMQLSIGTLIRMLAIIQMMYGAIVLLKSFEKEEGPEAEDGMGPTPQPEPEPEPEPAPKQPVQES